MKIYITIIIYLILISSCSTYYTDDELTKLSNNLLQKIQDIEDSLEKNKQRLYHFSHLFCWLNSEKKQISCCFCEGERWILYRYKI
jgi:uncharacterized protein YxeA